ncbi:DUF3253 domain-containing protein [Streptomyces anandii]|uniref:DUF3253 domain-containing protein n=1 Tax=Streptomyces anandii TaxID=285454 RepID=A0ABW6HDS2_9ACTN
MAETDRQLAQRLERVIMNLLDRRAATASICPSDAAREAYEGDDKGWRALMEPARRAAWRSQAITGGSPTPQTHSHHRALTWTYALTLAQLEARGRFPRHVPRRTE